MDGSKGAHATCATKPEGDSKGTIVVLGATGNQGKGAVDALLQSGKWHVRGITRDKSKAVDLAARGVDLVEADLDDRATLVKAFVGADALFLVTTFQGAAAEIQHGKNAVDAAKEAGISYVVFSGGSHVPQEVLDELPTLPDGWTIPNVETKGVILDYLELSGLPYTNLLTASFYENALNYTTYLKQPDGSYIFSFNAGTVLLARHAVADIGQTVAAVLEDPQKYQGKAVPVVSEHSTYSDIAADLSKVTGLTVKYVPCTDEQFAALPFPPAASLANMYAYLRKSPRWLTTHALSAAIVKGPSFAEWAAVHKEQLVAKITAS